MGRLSEQRLTGVLSVAQKFNRAVAKSPRQEPPPDSGIESFEFWLPERRPGGRNFAIRIDPPQNVSTCNRCRLNGTRTTCPTG